MSCRGGGGSVATNFNALPPGHGIEDGDEAWLFYGASTAFRFKVLVESVSKTQIQVCLQESESAEGEDETSPKQLQQLDNNID